MEGLRDRKEKNVTFETYLEQTKAKFSETSEVDFQMENPVTVAYEEVFEWKWFATKLKIFSFITYKEEVGIEDLISYSKDCRKYANKNYKGLPKGFQNGIVSNQVLVAHKISQDALSITLERPVKRFSFFEKPILVNLTNQRMEYFHDNIAWGMVYNQFFIKYIQDHFAI